MIDGLEFKGGDNFIDKALLLANERLFTPEGGMRDDEEDVQKVRCLDKRKLLNPWKKNYQIQKRISYQ